MRASESSGYSPEELLRVKDFEDMTSGEAQQARRLLEQASWRVAERRTRRMEPSRRGLVDLRRSARQSIHSAGELIHLYRQRQRVQRRPIVLICDVSGSMERYSKMLILFARALTKRENVETFIFSTRLTRITRILQHRDPDLALTTLGRAAHDFSGGTRIGEAFREFNLRWARRVLGHGAVLIVISDGWDRGDVGILKTEVDRLRRSVHRLIWLNPLLGSESYEPATAGMAAALPYCDDFLPAHNIASLDELGELLAELGPRVPLRPRAARVTSAIS